MLAVIFTSYVCDPKGVKGKIRFQKPNKVLRVFTD